MLPFFMRYSHINYAREGTFYLNEMHQLPPEVKAEFYAGNFVMKRGIPQFNQVDPDQSGMADWDGQKGQRHHWANKDLFSSEQMGCLRSHLVFETRETFGLGSDDTLMHKESRKGTQKQDNKDEDHVMMTEELQHVF